MCEPSSNACHFSGGGIIQLLILRLLHEKSDHGYILMQRIQEMTGPNYTPESGTVYTILRRLENRGLLKSEWESNSGTIDRRTYTLTEKGQAQLVQGLKMIKARRNLFDLLITYFDDHIFSEINSQKDESNE